MPPTTILLASFVLLSVFAAGIAGARAQSGTLQVPAQRPTDAPHASPSASPAPREPVRQGSGKATPVVQPHGTPHAQKPPAHGAKPAATAKPAPTAAAPATEPTAPAPAVIPEAPGPADTRKPAVATKGVVPRFAALRFDDVNMRRGPGPRYPIEWVYKRRDLPVQIEREYDIWRLIRDPDGTRGWVSEASLTGRRTFIITAPEATIRREAADSANAVAILKQGVIGRIRSCAADAEWCNVQTGDYRGFLKRAQFWGSQPGEPINP